MPQNRNRRKKTVMPSAITSDYQTVLYATSQANNNSDHAESLNATQDVTVYKSGFTGNSVVGSSIPTALAVPSSSSSPSNSRRTERNPTRSGHQPRQHRPTRGGRSSYQDTVVVEATVVADSSAPSWGANKLPEPERLRLKRRRQNQQVIVGTTAATAGLILLGPLGLVIGAVSGAAITKAVGKSRERKIAKKYAKQTKQNRRTVASSLPAHAAAVA